MSSDGSDVASDQESGSGNTTDSDVSGNFNLQLSSDEDTKQDKETSQKSSRDNLSTSDKLPPASEWIDFNKKVISMRPAFRSARVKFIHNATRQIKQLRNKKGKPEEIKKNNNKADRLVKEISYVKGLSKDVIAKFALLHSQEEVGKIISDSESTMEYRVKAKLARTPIIMKVADQYHKDHPNWREDLVKLIQVAGKTMKTKRRKLRGKKRKRKDVAPRVNTNGDPKKCISAESDGTGRFDASNFPEAPEGTEHVLANGESSYEGSSDDESPEDEAESDNFTKPGTNNLDLNKGTQNKLSSGSQGKDVCRQSKNCTKSKSKDETATIKHTKKEKQPEKSLQSSNEESNEEWEMQRDQTSDDEFPENGDNKEDNEGVNIDPFFITADNREYKTQWKVEPADSVKPTVKRKKFKEEDFVFKNLRSYDDIKRTKKERKAVVPPQATTKPTKPIKEKSFGNTNQPSVLHPSWQAKKKLQATMAPFQGKKILFDD